uniref:Uncharacterized protein n=1 Tax=Amphimedon queenslandica TaxID=400682 RepID=A0A1X7TYU2_AMPQE
MNGLTINVTLGQVLSVSKHAYTGSGALIVFACDYITGSHNVTINNSLITYNFEDLKSQKYLKFPHHVQNYYSILSSAGLTVLYTQTNYPANVSVLKTSFTKNLGTSMFFLHYKTNHGRVVFDQVSFERNIATIESPLILLLMIDVSNVSYP